MPSPTDRVFAAVLFDMDGTLVSSIASVERCWTRWAAEHGLDGVRHDDHHGVPARDIVDRLLADRSVEARAAALRRIVELEVADVDGITVLPGAAAALVGAGERGAIVTSCSGDLAVARLRASGLEVPRVVVTADDVAAGKPDPEPFVAAARRLGVRPQDCLVVEDSTAGVVAGRAAGATTLGLTTTQGPGGIVADVVVADLAAVRLVPGTDGVRLLVA